MIEAAIIKTINPHVLPERPSIAQVTRASYRASSNACKDIKRLAEKTSETTCLVFWPVDKSDPIKNRPRMFIKTSSIKDLMITYPANI